MYSYGCFSSIAKRPYLGAFRNNRSYVWWIFITEATLYSEMSVLRQIYKYSHVKFMVKITLINEHSEYISFNLRSVCHSKKEMYSKRYFHIKRFYFSFLRLFLNKCAVGRAGSKIVQWKCMREERQTNMSIFWVYKTNKKSTNTRGKYKKEYTWKYVQSVYF